jgi:hypothetical protein
MAERAVRSPTHFSFFEHLVCMVAEADLAEIHQSLQLRKIGSRSAEFERAIQPRPAPASAPKVSRPRTS